jgi:hypothetical protein
LGNKCLRKHFTLGKTREDKDAEEDVGSYWMNKRKNEYSGK